MYKITYNLNNAEPDTQNAYVDTLLEARVIASKSCAWRLNALQAVLGMPDDSDRSIVFVMGKEAGMVTIKKLKQKKD